MTTEPGFLALDELLEIHRDQIARYGGTQGIRDVGLLNSALAMPAATFGGVFLHSDLFEMAAAYLFHIVKNHAFIDGNKRVGAVAVNVFLHLNNIRFAPNQDEYTQLVLSVATGDANKAAIAEFLRLHSKLLQE